MPSPKYSCGTPTRTPARLRSELASPSSASTCALVASCGSQPAITWSPRAASRTLAPNTPTWSRLDANAISPYLDTRPYVGLTPTVPVSAAGCRIEPPVSEPMASGVMPDATATALPPDEPPGMRVGS
jgi:hypothetical protein